MTIIVTGGAGHIGSVMVDHLVERGEGVVILDELARGHSGAVDKSVPFYKGSTSEVRSKGDNQWSGKRDGIRCAKNGS
jgi:UDP-glucose 4-epimerase